MPSAGYSGTPLVKKLGIKPGARVAVSGVPDDYWDLVSPLPEGVVRLTLRATDLDVVHLFHTRRAALEKAVGAARRRIVRNGMIWVSWPKKSSGVPTELTEDVVRAVAFKHRLVDVKVCAVDETWSGLKLMIRKKDR